MSEKKAVRKTVDIKYLYATILIAIIIIAGIGVATFYRTTEEEGPREYRIVVIGKALVPYWETLFLGAEDMGKELGVNVETWAPELETVPPQVQKLNEFIATKPDGILLACADPYALNPGIDAAHAEGIPVITFDSDAIGSSRMAYVCVNITVLGQKCAWEIVDLLERKGVPLEGAKVLISTGSVTAENVLVRLEVFEEIMDEHGIEIANIVNNEGDMAKAVELITTALTADPDIDAIWGVWSNDGPAAGEACRRVGKAPGEVIVVGIGMRPDIYKDLIEGYEAATIGFNNYEFGKYCVQYMYDILKARDETKEGGGFGWILEHRERIPNWPEYPTGTARTFIDLGTSMIEGLSSPSNGNLTAYVEANPEYMEKAVGTDYKEQLP